MKRVEERLVLKKCIKRFLYKTMVIIIVVLLGLILTKKNPKLKKVLKDNMYNDSFPINKMKSIYRKYNNDINNTVVGVFKEDNNLEKIEKYNGGIKLYKNDSSISVIESGVIIHIGDLNEEGNSIIIEQVDGVECIYSNIDTADYKLYDYVEKGDILGSSINNMIILKFRKNNEEVNYKKYF